MNHRSTLRFAIVKATLFGGVFLAAGTGSLQAFQIAVPNGSFESPVVPVIFPALPYADFWTQAGGTPFQDAGVFPNVALPDPSHIDNMDGNQAAYLLQYAPLALYQTLADTFQIGQSYQLTVGLFGKGGIDFGAKLILSLYYGTPANPIATNTITYAGPNVIPEHFYDFDVNIAEVQGVDAWAGGLIGIQLQSIPAPGGTGAGYWDVDNVRLTATPEPTTLGLLALGFCGLALRRSRPHRRG